MRPLIKWPGGKSREYKNVNEIIPSDIDKYIEPFFGGGGIFFNLEPTSAIINDINENLMMFYKYVKEQDHEFKSLVMQIADDWDNLSIIAEKVFNDTKKYKKNIYDQNIKEEIIKLSKDNKLPKLINGQEHYWTLLCDGLINKLNRIVSLEIKSGEFSNNDFYEQIVAVAKGAYYYYLRDKFTPKNEKAMVAQFYFLREYCFGSMFRFNSEGKFNIPYGGASYNDKQFHSKVNNCFSIKTADMLKNTDIHSEDFRTFFKNIAKNIASDDFCFFDPPYDTEFSEYDKQSFGKKDQEDLAIIFGNLKCKALIVIKKSDFINRIYKKQQLLNPNIIINEYDKNYSYNVRGRNNRSVTHLLILNYDPKNVNREEQISLEEQLRNDDRKVLNMAF